MKLLRSVAGYNDLCMTRQQMKKLEWKYNVHNLSVIVVGYRCKWTQQLLRMNVTHTVPY